ncbi:MAG: energy transducer TonB [Bacteroidia bacterium]|nr:energy transducer TonB [Bacteroidia bacterium]
MTQARAMAAAGLLAAFFATGDTLIQYGALAGEPVPSSAAPAPLDWRQAEQPPKALNFADVRVQIGYPRMAFDAMIQGTEVFRVLVDERGQYVQHTVSSSFHPLLRMACEPYLSAIQFVPAQHQGRPVSCWVDVSVSFSHPGR